MVTKKTMTLNKFKEYIKKNDANTVSHENMEEDEFKNSFILSCKKCGSMNVHFFGEAGVDYGGYTGYSSGINGFKCRDCGNAITWYQ